MLKQEEEFFIAQAQLARAHKIMRLYRLAHGRDAATVLELNAWKRRELPGEVEPDAEDFDAIGKTEDEG